MASKALSAPGSARVIGRPYSRGGDARHPSNEGVGASGITPSGGIDAGPRGEQHRHQSNKGAEMPTTTNNRFDDLAIKGRVVYPTDPDWDAAHQAFSTLVDQRPEAMVFPADAARRRHDRQLRTRARPADRPAGDGAQRRAARRARRHDRRADVAT